LGEHPVAEAIESPLLGEVAHLMDYAKQ